MTENDYTVIKPVHGLGNLAGVNSSKDGQGKKKDQELPSKRQQQDDLLEENLVKSVEDEVDRDVVSEDPDEHIIDFCA